MNFTESKIFDFVVGTAEAVSTGLYSASVPEPIPAEFPALYLREINETEPTQALDLAFNHDTCEQTFEAQVVSNKLGSAMEEANTIMDAVCFAFRRLYFKRTMRQPLDNADSRSYRIVARFSRVVGGADKFITDLPVPK